MNKTNKLRNNTAILLSIGGILLNLVLSTAVSVFGLLVYLDTVGTVAVAVMGGYLPGVIAGFATNIITGNAGIEAGVGMSSQDDIGIETITTKVVIEEMNGNI